MACVGWKDAAPAAAILLATHNGRRFLKERLSSLVAQDWPNIDFWASDDGSADGTAAAAPQWAKGEFLVADDLWDPDKLRSGVEQLAAEDPSRPAGSAQNLKALRGLRLCRQSWKRSLSLFVGAAIGGV